MYFVYVVTCNDGSLYTGTAVDISKRIYQHYKRGKECAKYTRSHPIKSISAVWKAPDKSSAFKLEYAIKKLKREDKLALVAEPENVRVMIESLSDIEYHPVRKITLDECVAFAENRMTHNEKKQFILKLSE